MGPSGVLPFPSSKKVPALASGDPRGTARWKELCRRLRKALPPICWVCGEAIDLTLDRNDRWAWTLDHVLPYVTHPELVFVESNLRPAHRYCNSTRAYSKQQSANISRDW